MLGENAKNPHTACRQVSAPLVLVRWYDTSGSHGWQPVSSQSLRPVVCESVGFLLESTDEHVLLVSTLAADEDLGSDFSSIPKGMVLEMRYLILTEDEESAYNLEILREVGLSE